MLATPVKRSAAETAIRPTVFAASALRTDWHELAVTQQKLEVVLREDLNPISRRQKPSPGSGAAVAADVRGILVTASVEQGVPTGLTNITAENMDCRLAAGSARYSCHGTGEPPLPP